MCESRILKQSVLISWCRSESFDLQMICMVAKANIACINSLLLYRWLYWREKNRNNWFCNANETLEPNCMNVDGHCQKKVILTHTYTHTKCIHRIDKKKKNRMSSTWTYHFLVYLVWDCPKLTTGKLIKPERLRQCVGFSFWLLAASAAATALVPYRYGSLCCCCWLQRTVF